MKDRLLFYDIEVFHRAYFAVIIDEEGNVSKYFMDGKGQSRGYDNFKLARQKIKGATLVGYNNYFYDDKIFPLMLAEQDTESLKGISDKLISGSDTNIVTAMANKTLDCIQQIDVSHPSLKKIEANLGRSVFESSIPFDKTDDFTDTEVAETFDYCTYDVESTMKVYDLRKSNYFGAKDFLISMLPNNKQLRERAQKWNTTSIGAKVLLGNGSLDIWAAPYFDRKELTAWDHPLYSEVPAEVKAMWIADNNQSITVHDFDNDIVFGFGGIHSVNTKKRVFENVTNIDVTSLYPNLIIKLNVLGEHTDKFATMVRERVGHKKTNKPLAAAEKIIINSVYGLLDSNYSPFYNHYAANAIRFYGQCILYQLAKRLSPYVEIVQLNTDGMAFVINDGQGDVVKDIYEAWSKEQGLNLEPSHFDKFIQKDVNNYVGVKSDGHLKVKGKDVARYASDSYFRNNSTRIVDKAIVNYFVNNVPIEQTVKENLDNPKLFQIVLQAGNTFEGTYDQNGNKYNKVNRVFAAKGGNVVQLLKRYPADKVDKNGKPKNPVKYPSAPENMVVYNDSLDGVNSVPDIDVDFYVELCENALSNWTGEVKLSKAKKKRKSKKAGSSINETPVERISAEEVEDTDFRTQAEMLMKDFKIYPLSFGSSVPVKGSHGSKDATRNPDVLDNWTTGQKHNIGIALRANDLVLLDIDVGHESGTNGIGVLNKYMQDNHTELPNTYTERTPSGGYHFFFADPTKKITKNITGLLGEDSGIDVQVAGTPIYPSVKFAESGDFGQYKPLPETTETIEALPSWLLTLILDRSIHTDSESKKQKKLSQSEKVRKVIDMQRSTIDENRNDSLFEYGRLLKQLKLTDKDIKTELATFNSVNVVPPLTANEVRTVTKSITK